jgi:hypothetical protein
MMGDGVTAGRDVEASALGETPEESVERFATEATRMAAEHDAAETV